MKDHMRNGNNKRIRGRNRGKGPNPLSRSYESNGPDIKIRGTAQHIGEKYLQLARDAHSSGDHVGAENYLQHAEHYFRLIAAAYEAQRQQALPPRQDGSPAEDEGDDEDDDDFAGPFDKRFESPVFQRPEAAPGQAFPGREFQPGENREFQPRNENRDFQPRGENREFQPRGENRDFQPRGERRDFQPRGENREFQPRGENRDFQNREFNGERRERFQNPQRFNGPRYPQDPAAGEQPDIAPGGEAEAGGFPPREGQNREGRRFETRRERFERQRAERFAERNARREPGEDGAPAPAPAPAAEEPEALGLPAFITGGGASSPAPVAAPAAAPDIVEAEGEARPVRRRRRTPREDVAPETTPSENGAPAE